MSTYERCGILMKLRIDFGMNKRREVTFYGELDIFPTALIFEGDKYEWFMYQNDSSGTYDKILQFSPMKQYDPRWLQCVDFHERFESGWGSKKNNGCECGAIHTSFPQIHMFYCPQWKKIEVL
jgi:hypothetical protein